MNFQALDARLTSRNKPVNSRKIANNTYAQRRDDGRIAVRLHATDVLSFGADDSVVLDTGGWLTVTTKERFNRFLPGGLRVYSERGRWYIYRSGLDRVPYFDGIELDTVSYVVLNPSGMPDVLAEDERIAKIRRDIKRYVSGYTDEVITELLAQGGAGDCFFCGMHEVGTGQPLGDLSASDHLDLHVAEDYRMLSLLGNAVTAAGYRSPAAILHHAPDLARRALAKYLRKRLITGVAVA